MDPTEKGWFLKYIELRPKTNFENRNTSELAFYKYFQGTGIMFGHPLNLPESLKIDSKAFPVKDRMKVILSETFIFSAENLLQEKWENENFASIIQNQISEFYSSLNNHKNKSILHKISHFSSKNYSAEEWFNTRIKVKSTWKIQFWNMFFYNVLLYTDTLQFIDWLNSKDKFSIDFSSEKEKIRLTALKVIAAAAHANHTIEKEEKRFYNFFLESAELEAEDLKKAKEFLTNYIGLDQIDFDTNIPWLHRKYFLDLAILSLWADKNLGDDEQIFLEQLTQKLHLEIDDLETSQISIESFVLHNWEKIHFLQTKQNYLILSQRLIERLKSISFKYKNQIGNEIGESKELVELLTKSANHDLSVEEKEKIRTQLIDILKSIPAFVYLSLPFTFFTLPIIFKILPKSVFPSAFDENRLMQKKNRKTIG
jgi:hypothetical protein